MEVAPEGGEGQPACDGNSEEEGRNWKVSLSEKTRAGDSKCIIESASSMWGETSHDRATSMSRAATKLRKGKRFESRGGSGYVGLVACTSKTIFGG